MIKMLNFWNWYTNGLVEAKILRYCKNREFALITPLNSRWKYKGMRNMKIDFDYQYKNILNNWKKYVPEDVPFNCYYSLAHYDRFYMWKGTQSRAECYKAIDNYDMLIDFDAGEHRNIYQCLDCMKSLHAELEFYNVPHHCRFSGRGFHMIVPGFIIPPLSFNPDAENNIYAYCQKLGKSFYNKYGEFIDYSIYDCRRVVKCPFTVAIYEDEAYISVPLNKDDIDSFDLKEYAFNKVNYDKLLRHDDCLFSPNNKANESWLKFVEVILNERTSKSIA